MGPAMQACCAAAERKPPSAFPPPSPWELTRGHCTNGEALEPLSISMTSRAASLPRIPPPLLPKEAPASHNAGALHVPARCTAESPAQCPSRTSSLLREAGGAARACMARWRPVLQELTEAATQAMQLSPASAFHLHGTLNPATLQLSTVPQQAWQQCTARAVCCLSEGCSGSRGLQLSHQFCQGCRQAMSLHLAAQRVPLALSQVYRCSLYTPTPLWHN